MGGAAPQPVGGFIAFFQPEWLLLVVCSGRRWAPRRPFRPLNRSLGLLPSRALSHPTQVAIASAEDLRCCIQPQRKELPTPTVFRIICIGIDPNFQDHPRIGKCSL